jgi:hypothetical protein
MTAQDRDRPPPWQLPTWAVLGVTTALLALCALLLLLNRDVGLLGAILASVTGYWLPTRPNRRPQDPTDST